MLLFSENDGYNLCYAVQSASPCRLHPIRRRRRLTVVWLCVTLSRLPFRRHRKLQLMTLLLRASSLRHLRLIPVAALLFAAHTMVAQAPAAATKPSASAAVPDRASSYYHYGLARLYEDMAVSAGRSDYAA